MGVNQNWITIIFVGMLSASADALPTLGGNSLWESGCALCADKYDETPKIVLPCGQADHTSTQQYVDVAYEEHLDVALDFSETFLCMNLIVSQEDTGEPIRLGLFFEPGLITEEYVKARFESVLMRSCQKYDDQRGAKCFSRP